MAPRRPIDQGRAGKAHFSYFDERSHALFEWDTTDATVQVTIGDENDEADPATRMPIEAPTYAEGDAVPYVLTVFEEFCKNFADEELETYA